MWFTNRRERFENTASCGFYWLDASLYQACWLNQVASSLSKSLQVVETRRIKLVDKKS